MEGQCYSDKIARFPKALIIRFAAYICRTRTNKQFNAKTAQQGQRLFDMPLLY